MDPMFPLRSRAMPVELVPLAAVRAPLSAQHVIPSGPLGMRVVADVSGATMTGDRIRATQLGTAAADWLTMAADGIGTLDVRVTMQTDDGAVVLVSYRGRLLLDTGTIFSAPLFETGDERYAWLNRIQAVGKGRLEDGNTVVVYELYELR